MLFGSKEFKIMEQSADALWQKQKVISHNIANYETPGFKAQKLTFKEALSGEQGKLIEVNVDADTTTKARPDGNNVNMVTENLELYKTLMQTQYLYDKINGKFSGVRNVFSQMPR